MRTRAVLITAGVLTMAYAGYGILTDPAADPAGILVFLAAVLIGHDVIWMPGVLAAGALLAHLVPHRHRPVVRAATLAAAAVTVVALPLVLGFGRTADNPSALPLPYARNLLLVLLTVAAAASLSISERTARDRRVVRRTARSRPPVPAGKKSESTGEGPADRPDE